MWVSWTATKLRRHSTDSDSAKITNAKGGRTKEFWESTDKVIERAQAFRSRQKPCTVSEFFDAFHLKRLYR